MVTEKKSFVMYADYEEHFNLLCDEDKGKLISAIFRYVRTNELPVLDGMLKMAFSFIRLNLDRDFKKYEGTIEKRSIAGRKGGKASGKARAKQKEANEANASKSKQTKQKEANEADTVTDNVTVIDTVINNTEHPPDGSTSINDFFEQAWKLYPLKKGKGQVGMAQKKKLQCIGIEELKRAIERYKLDLKKDDWRRTQYGSTFFNSGYVDYLDNNYHPEETVKPRSTVPITEIPKEWEKT